MAETKYVSQANLSYILGKIKSTYVQQVTGKGLSTNDFTTELLNKLNGIEAGAQANVIESVKVNGVAQSVTDKAVNITVPTKTSEITNDSGFITTADIPEGAAASTTVPLMDGTAAVGTELAFARGDHVHPTDTSRAAAADLTNEINRAKAAEQANATAAANAQSAAEDAQAAAEAAQVAADAAQAAVDAVEGDYLVEADKTELQGNIDALEDRVEANESAIEVLNGTGEGSVDKKITDAFNDFSTKVTDDGVVNSYKELIDYAAEHGSEFTELVGEVDANTKAIATLNGTGAGSVSKAISDAIAAENLGQYATDTELAAVSAQADKGVADAAAAQTTADAIAADYVKASELVALTEAEIDAIWNAA